MAIHETFNDALTAAIYSAGGFDYVGGLLFGINMGEADAGRRLRELISSECDDEITFKQGMIILDLAREQGCDEGIRSVCERIGYFTPAAIPEESETSTEQSPTELMEETNELLRALGPNLRRLEMLRDSNLRAIDKTPAGDEPAADDGGEEASD